MLEQLSIKNYALIEDLHISFTEGLNVLTGETGAGKSIIIGALGLILGDRATAGIVRKGEQSCTIRAEFDISQNKELCQLLKEQSLTVEDNLLLLCREIGVNGKNRCLACDQVITLAMLQTIGGYLVDLHGQHEHQTILLAKEQLNILDDFGGVLPLRKDLAEHFRRYSELRVELESLINSEKERDHFIDLYQFQWQEITDARLQLDEEEQLEKEINLLNNAEKIFGLVNETYGNLYEDEGAILSRLSKIKSNLSLLKEMDESITSVLELLQQGVVNLEEVNDHLRSYKDKVIFDPVKLDQLIERKELISQLKNKYGQTVREILTYQGKIEKELKELSSSAESKAGLAAKIPQSYQKSLSIAQKLSVQRHKAANRLESEIERQLKDLGLAKLRFRVNFVALLDEQSRPELSSLGIETIEFLISPNVGEDLKPLSQIVSGGEMSRIMLGLKTVLAESDKVPTLIFDEIDAGIGGSMAEIVGKKLSVLSAKHQIICVTHWPQIAGVAAAHFHVSKEIRNNRTYTKIEELQTKARVEELARMLGGESLTAISLKHAQELLKHP